MWWAQQRPPGERHVPERKDKDSFHNSPVTGSFPEAAGRIGEGIYDGRDEAKDSFLDGSWEICWAVQTLTNRVDENQAVCEHTGTAPFKLAWLSLDYHQIPPPALPPPPLRQNTPAGEHFLSLRCTVPCPPPCLACFLLSQCEHHPSFKLSLRAVSPRSSIHHLLCFYWLLPPRQHRLLLKSLFLKSKYCLHQCFPVRGDFLLFLLREPFF